MLKIGVMGNGPIHTHPDFTIYKDEIDLWIGADGGCLTLIANQIEVSYAVGDFDSIQEWEKGMIKDAAVHFHEYSIEKDRTDIEIAILKAVELNPDVIYIFGVTGGRLDHELINIQLLYLIMSKGIQGIIVDKSNLIELTKPNHYTIKRNKEYPNISFIPYSQDVKGLTLTGFYYPLFNQTISWGSTLCISNKLLKNSGTFSYDEGILLLIKSRDSGF